MSNKTEVQIADNSNEWIGLKKKSILNITNTNIFPIIQIIGKGGFGKDYRTNWRNSQQYLALRSFINLCCHKCKFAHQLVHAISCLHDEGIVHRDLVLILNSLYY